MTLHQRPAGRRIPSALAVTLWLAASTSTFLVLLNWWWPDTFETLRSALGDRLLALGGIPPGDYFLVLTGVLGIELAVLGWRRSSVAHLVRGSLSARTDLLLGGLHALGWAPLVMSFFSAGVIWLIEYFAEGVIPIGLLSSMGPVWFQFLVVLLVTDFLDYWVHRIAHDWDFLWETHRFHHAATEFTVLTGTREHALYEAFRHLVVAIPLALLGASIHQYLIARLLMYVVDLLQHSMLPWTYGWAGRWLVYSPVGHRIHHSPRADQHTSNYGNMLVIWDRLFGTWYAGDDVNETIGLPHNPYNRQGIVVEYLHAVMRTVRALRTSIRTKRWRTGPGSSHAR